MSEIRKEHEAGIAFDWVVVRELRFVDNNERLEPEKVSGLRAEMGVEADVSDDGKSCTTRLRLVLRPPPGDDLEQFEVIAATVEARFSLEGESSVSMEEFAERQAPAILMPFVRQQIALATSNSRFGQVLVPPINVSAMMAEKEQAKEDREEEAQSPPSGG